MSTNKHKILIKAFFASMIIVTGIFYDTHEVGKYDIAIKYDRINDRINNNSNKQPNTTPVNKIIQEEIKEEIKVIEKKKPISDQELEQITNQIISLTHGSEDSNNQEFYGRLCDQYKQICDLTIYNGDFPNSQKLNYQIIIIYLVSKLDKYLSTTRKIRNTVVNIRLDLTNQGRRGLAGHQSIILHLSVIKSYREFYEVLTHELGHIIDLGIIDDSQSPRNTIYTEFADPAFGENDTSLIYYKFSWSNETTRYKTSTFKDFISGYALSDPFEDFAESVNLYLNHYQVFFNLAQTNNILNFKFSFMKKLFNNQYLLTDEENALKIINNSERRPWDSTTMRM